MLRPSSSPFGRASIDETAGRGDGGGARVVQLDRAVAGWRLGRVPPRGPGKPRKENEVTRPICLGRVTCALRQSLKGW
jgi:hypothetical protein